MASKFECICTECSDDGSGHVITRMRSRCGGCGLMSHHYNARIWIAPLGHSQAGQRYAVASYCGADDPMGNVGEVELNSGETFKDGTRVLVSWCCFTAKRER